MFAEDTDIRTMCATPRALMSASRAFRSHGLFTEILREHTHGGLVDYGRLHTDRRLDVYLRLLSDANTDKLSPHARLAFWINMYNAWTLKLICDRYPIRSIRDLHAGGFLVGTLLKRTVWDTRVVMLGAKRLSLNMIEHEIIRPLFKDPRIHFALVCGARGCPPLRSEAFEGDTLADQLNDQARIFLRDRTKNRFDVTKKVAHLSRIFKWYSRDFGTIETSMLFIAKFLPREVGDVIRSDPFGWKIRYAMYDWGLNSARNE